MSEYQYYEFQAVDQPLTQKQMGELRRYSSRAEITQSRFVNVYNYGDFGGDPDRLMEKFFDAFVYLANWGSRWFMLRIPGKLLGIKAVKAYCVDEHLSCRQKGSNVILSFRYEDEEGHEWVEGEGWLASLLPVRADLMRGDLRALYIAWLLAVQSEEVDEDTREPPVPPGLDNLTAGLNQFAKFLSVDRDLIAAAAEQSGSVRDETLSEKKLDYWLSNLPDKEKDALLARFIRNEDPHLAVELRKCALNDINGRTKQSSKRRRTASELLERARMIGVARKNQEAEKRGRNKRRREHEASAKRKEHLELLVGKEASLWARVNRLIDARLPKSYNEAVSLLCDLHDLSQMQGGSSRFASKMSRLYSKHRQKRTLVERFRKANLPGNSLDR